MLNREEYEHMMFDMMNHAAKAKEIGDKIANELAPEGDDELYDFLNQVQDCEVTEVGTALDVYERIVNR